jgi:uncharacterized protein (TIGR02300 family)
VAKAELGTKRECPECAVKYYDLGRNPCVCPKCGASLEPDVAPPAPVHKVETPKTDKKADVAPASEKVETVSLEVIGAEEQDGEPSIDESDEAALADIDIPDDDAEDEDSESNDAFFDSDDDDGTDVSDLLGTDIGKSNDEG